MYISDNTMHIVLPCTICLVNTCDKTKHFGQTQNVLFDWLAVQLGSAAAKLKEGKSAAHSRANNFWFWRKSLRAMAECTCVFCQGSIERNDSIVWAAAMPQSFGKVKYCKQCFEELL